MQSSGTWRSRNHGNVKDREEKCYINYPDQTQPLTHSSLPQVGEIGEDNQALALHSDTQIGLGIMGCATSNLQLPSHCNLQFFPNETFEC